jgi:hypothetical protein
VVEKIFEDGRAGCAPNVLERICMTAKHKTILVLTIVLLALFVCGMVLVATVANDPRTRLQPNPPVNLLTMPVGPTLTPTPTFMWVLT